MESVFLSRRGTLLVYDRAAKEQFCASCQITIVGARGIADTLIGRRFYEFLREKGLAPFQELGLSVVCAAVSRAHLRLIRHALRDVAVVTEHEGIEAAGRRLVWIEIREKESPPPPAPAPAPLGTA